ncbi:hypothetical protein J2X61_006607 [Bacillus sp. 3255]|nr:hypothetical protein [Bacillus sp. 3255]
MSVSRFEQMYEEWMELNMKQENNPRRREILNKGLGHGTKEFLRAIWFPTVHNFDHLYPEWEVRDFNNGYRYLDLAYMPEGAKGGIEIHGFGPHARDLDVSRFKDLCWRHSLLTLDRWTFLSIAYPSIMDEPGRCQQLVLAFIGTFLSTDVSGDSIVTKRRRFDWRGGSCARSRRLSWRTTCVSPSGKSGGFCTN